MDKVPARLLEPLVDNWRRTWLARNTGYSSKQPRLQWSSRNKQHVLQSNPAYVWKRKLRPNYWQFRRRFLIIYTTWVFIKQFQSQQKAKLQKEFDFIEALKQINLAATLTKRGPQNITREARAYQNLNAKLENVPSNHSDYQFVEQLIKDTHGRVKKILNASSSIFIFQRFFTFERSTHNNYTLDLVGLFRVARKGEREKYAKNIGNDILGWHGCPGAAVASILKTGLRIAPNGVANGKAYGQGLYFADCSSKSANYTKASSRDNIKVLFLCKVALGKSKILYRNDEQLPSTLGICFQKINNR